MLRRARNHRDVRSPNPKVTPGHGFRLHRDLEQLERAGPERDCSVLENAVYFRDGGHVCRNLSKLRVNPVIGDSWQAQLMVRTRTARERLSDPIPWLVLCDSRQSRSRSVVALADEF